MNDINTVIADSKINTELKARLEQSRNTIGQEGCVLVSPDIAIILSRRNDYSGGGGVARYNSLHAYYKGNSQIMEWQYADKWSSSNDRRNLMILDIGTCRVSDKEGKINILIKCIPPDGYQSRYVSFTFTPEPTSTTPAKTTLTAEQQESFVSFTQKEHKLMCDRLLCQWEKNTHTMPTPHGRVPYVQPRCQLCMVLKQNGLAVIKTEEQIDFKGMSNPQMQQKIFLLQWKDQSIKEIAEEHAFQNGGSANVDVISLSSSEIIIGTKFGPKTITL